MHDGMDGVRFIPAGEGWYVRASSMGMYIDTGMVGGDWVDYMHVCTITGVLCTCV